MRTVRKSSGRFITGKVEDVLPGLPEASYDAIVTDPPYGLEFMGKTWDKHVNYQKWCELWAAEAFRVLKPGGFLLAFGGTRTYHRLACAIEDAGFEIRDSLHWLYGCLTADTEILTEHGWKPGIEVVSGERVAQWDHQTGQISLAPVQQTYRASWDGPMRVLRNADTDQVLTPNHRVYHQPRQRKMTDGVRRSWYDGQWQVAEAGTLSTWDMVRLPLAGEHDGPGIGGEDYAALLGWVWTEGGFDLSGSGVRVYQSSVNQAKVDEIAGLMDQLGPHKRYDYQRRYKYASGEREYTATTWYFSGELAERVRSDLPGKRPTYALLWRMTVAEKRAFLRAAMLGDGSGWGTRTEQFHQKYEDDLIWLQTLLAMVGRAGKVGMRKNRLGGALYLRKVSETELQARHLRDAWEHYTGEVWCVQVPAGAFVARRNGKVFITGNSGFPKGLDVSKAIDRSRRDDVTHVAAFLRAARGSRPLGEAVKRLGFEGVNGTHGVAAFFTDDPAKARVPSLAHWAALRDLYGFGGDMDAEVARLNDRKGQGSDEWRARPAAGYKSRPGMAESWRDGKGWTGTDARGGDSVRPEAARWQGWNVALKPAHEPIILARKPLSESTVAANVLRWGTGALNVDGCRVAHVNGADLAESQGKNQHTQYDNQSARLGANGVYGDADVQRPDYDGSSGRWPPNLLLTHSASCRPAGTRQVKTSDPRRADGTVNGSWGTQGVYGGANSGGMDKPRYGEGGTETVQAFTCVEGCPVAGLDAQSGVQRARGNIGESKGGGGMYGHGLTTNNFGAGDKGGASRFFPQFSWSPEYDLPFMYCAKAPKKERPQVPGLYAHPTVKPLALMRWLVRLVTPPGGLILDPFAGTGTTIQAALDEGFRCAGVDSWLDAVELAKIRLAAYDCSFR